MKYFVMVRLQSDEPRIMLHGGVDGECNTVRLFDTSEGAHEFAGGVWSAKKYGYTVYPWPDHMTEAKELEADY